MNEHRRVPEPLKYVVAHLRQALAEDDRTNVQDIQVKITAGKVFLLGNVESTARRRAVEQVAREVVPDELTVVNELWIAQYEPPRTTETLR